MPKYEFLCNNCKEAFEVTMSVKDKGITQIYCPSCKSQDLEQLYNGVNIHTGKIVKAILADAVEGKAVVLQISHEICMETAYLYDNSEGSKSFKNV